MTNADRAAIRAHIILKGAERVRITRNGEVHAFGVMPNTNTTGWYFAGYDKDVLAELREIAARA